MERVKRFSQKHVILFSTILTFIALAIWSIDIDGNPLGGIDMLLTHIVTLLLTVLIMWKLSLIQNAGFTKNGFIKGIIMGLPFLALGIISVLFSNSGTDWSVIKRPSVYILFMFTANMFMVGAAEEMLFRGLILNNMLLKWGSNKRGIMKSVWLSAIIFGAMHIINIFALPYAITVIVQAVNAAFASILFAAVYLRGKNIWSVIVVHALVDWIALILPTCSTSASSIIAVKMSIWQGLIVVIGGSLPPLLIGLFLMRKFNAGGAGGWSIKA
jgi:membrane protease YdiL (CAAX protease family)